VTLVATLDHLLDGETNPITTIVIPILGAILNFAMLIAVFYYGITGSSDSARNSQIAIAVSIAFFLFGFAYIFIQGQLTGRSILLPHDTSHPLRERSDSRR
jgi:basic amino acid/polyamine antiporter, APA family